MRDLKTWLKKPRVFWVIGGGVLLVILAAGIIGLVIVQAAPAQPFPYPHVTHIANGIACVFCHSGVYRSSSAGLPTKAKCDGCHNNIKVSTPLLKEWAQYSNTHASLEWVPVALLPDFVYFSHQPHLKAQLDCVNCHGDLSKMTTAKPQSYWNMGWCLDCHKKMAPDKFVKLSDCGTCHK